MLAEPTPDVRYWPLATIGSVPASPDVLQLLRRSVNCSAAEIEEWHTTEASAAVGSRRPGDQWSVGQLAGMRTVEILDVSPEEWTPADEAHVRRVSGFVRRHRAQWPRGDVRETRWRHSLRNWGHDPLWESRLSLRAGPAEGQLLLVVDTVPVGRLTVTDTGAGGVLVERLEVDESWRNQGLASAALHRLAIRHHGDVGVEVPVDASEFRTFLRRKHFDAPAPDSPTVNLTGW